MTFVNLDKRAKYNIKLITVLRVPLGGATAFSFRATNISRVTRCRHVTRLVLYINWCIINAWPATFNRRDCDVSRRGDIDGAAGSARQNLAAAHVCSTPHS